MKLFFRQLKAELIKLFARKRTYIGFGAFIAIEAIVLLLLQVPKIKAGMRRFLEGAGYEFETYYSGLTLAFITVQMTLLFVGGLYLALVSGDVVSKEVEDGTMRMLLCRPASRMRVLWTKYLSTVIYSFTLIFFVCLTALGVGLAYRGTGGMFVYAWLEQVFALFDFGEGLSRFLLAMVCMSVSCVTIATLGFMLSCMKMKPAAATIVTLSIVFVDMVFRMTEQFAGIREYLLTTHMATWVNVYRTPIPVWRMVEDYAILTGINATLFLIGAIYFSTRDLKA